MRALRFTGELKSKCLALGHAAGRGTVRPELEEGIRIVTHGRYPIFYHENESVIRIERIMHSDRDIGSDDLDIDE